jgi:hypothetical protein
VRSLNTTADVLRMLQQNYRAAVKRPGHDHGRRLRAWRCLSAFVDARELECARVRAQQDAALALYN